MVMVNGDGVETACVVNASNLERPSDLTTEQLSNEHPAGLIEVCSELPTNGMS